MRKSKSNIVHLWRLNMDRRVFLKTLVLIPLATAMPVAASRHYEFPENIDFVTQEFDHGRNLGLCGQILDVNGSPIVRSGVLIRGYGFMGIKGKKRNYHRAKVQVCEQLRTRMNCVYGENILEGNEVTLERKL